MSFLLDAAAQLLEPAEREAVCGDLAESRDGNLRALGGILGLAARRQAALWKHWQPWLVLALSIPLALALTLRCRIASDQSATYLWLYLNNWTSRYLATGFRSDALMHAAFLVARFAGVACWSWTVGFALGSLARRSILTNGALFAILLVTTFGVHPPLLSGDARHFHGNDAAFSLAFYRIALPMLLQVVLVWTPALSGIHQSACRGTLQLLAWLTVGITMFISMGARFEQIPVWIAAATPMAYLVTRRFVKHSSGGQACAR